MRHHHWKISKDELLANAQGTYFLVNQHASSSYIENPGYGATSQIRPLQGISHEEYQRHIKSRLCFLCHKVGKLSRDRHKCTETPPTAEANVINGNDQQYPLFKLKLGYQEVEYIEEALLDSGATQNSMESYLADRLGFTLVNSPTTVVLGNRTTA